MDVYTLIVSKIWLLALAAKMNAPNVRTRDIRIGVKAITVSSQGKPTNSHNGQCTNSGIPNIKQSHFCPERTSVSLSTWIMSRSFCVSPNVFTPFMDASMVVTHPTLFSVFFTQAVWSGTAVELSHTDPTAHRTATVTGMTHAALSSFPSITVAIQTWAKLAHSSCTILRPSSI